jgi:hypothetical protein
MVCAICTDMDDQIIDAAMARALHADAQRRHPLVGWVIMHDPPDYPDQFIARMMTDVPSSYVLIADTLAGVQEQLPPGLERINRRPIHPPEVVEIWLAE